MIVAVADARTGHRLVAVAEDGDAGRLAACLDEYNARAPGFLRVSDRRTLAGFPRSELGKLMRGRIAGMTNA